MNEKLKIVFICNEYPPGKFGGIGVFTKKLAEGLAAIGHDISVIGLYFNIDKKIEETIENVRVIRIPANTKRFSLLSNKLKLYKQLKEISLIKPIDIIESPDFEAPIAYFPRLAKKMITRLHGSHTYFSHERNIKPSFLIKHLEKKQLKKSDKIVSVSKYTALKTKFLFSLINQPSVIYNCVNIDNHSNNIKENYHTQKKVIYFGTLAEKKGIYPLAMAWRKFSEYNPDWSLTVIGKDPFENGISNKKKMLTLLGKSHITVSFVSQIENKELINSLKKYDFAILPSFSEAFALAPLEAMATGLPVIISNMSSGPELIRNGIDGWLCDPKNPNSLFEVMNIVANSEIERKQIAERALIKIKTTYNFKFFIQKNIEFYKNLFLK